MLSSLPSNISIILVNLINQFKKNIVINYKQVNK